MGTWAEWAWESLGGRQGLPGVLTLVPSASRGLCLEQGQP